MSKWSHVAGVVRYDMFFLGTPINEPEFKTCKFGDNEKKWTECNVPCGSEGSLTVGKTDVYRNDTQAFVTYSFSGDLRDYSYEDDHEELEKWMQSLILEKGLMIIRQAVFQVHYEDREGLVTYQYDQDSNRFIAGELK